MNKEIILNKCIAMATTSQLSSPLKNFKNNIFTTGIRSDILKVIEYLDNIVNLRFFWKGLINLSSSALDILFVAYALKMAMNIAKASCGDKNADTNLISPVIAYALWYVILKTAIKTFSKNLI